MFGPNLRALRDEVVRTSNSPAPYDVAQRLVEVLHSDTYHYDTDVRDVDCGMMATPECFATSGRGYCLHYATTMAVIMRDLGIPARVVRGSFLGSARQIRQPRSSATEVRMPGWRCISQDTSGSHSTRPGEAFSGLIGCAAACPADGRSQQAVSDHVEGPFNDPVALTRIDRAPAE